MTISYRVNTTEGDHVVEVEAIDGEDITPTALVTLTDDSNPSASAHLNLEEIAELREVLEKVAKTLGG